MTTSAPHTSRRPCPDEPAGPTSLPHGTPETPDLPEASDTPDTPDAPDTPDTANTPGLPDASGARRPTDPDPGPRPDGAGPQPPRTVPSPVIARLAARLARTAEDERDAVVEEFWDAAARAGTPLAEPLDDDPGHLAVTFLRRGHRAVGQVLLLVNTLVERERLADALMERLPGTDVWHLAYRLRADHLASYRMVADLSPGPPPADPAVAQQRLRGLCAFAGPDPLNPALLPGRRGSPGSSVLALPGAPARAWAEPREGVPRGRVDRYRVPSRALSHGPEKAHRPDETEDADGADAEVRGGDGAGRVVRDVYVYLPPGAEGAARTEGVRLPVLVLCDGDMWFGRLGLAGCLDALIADGRIPPLAVLAPDSVDGPTRRRELAASEEYVRFLADELLPWAAARWPVTGDGARTVVAGQGLGGLAALYAARLRPERFGVVLAQSPSPWWRPGAPQAGPGGRTPGAVPGGEPPWLASLFMDGPPDAGLSPAALRVRLDAGLHEGPSAGLVHTLGEALRAHGHRVVCRTVNGGHDWAWWREALADGLVELLGGTA